MKDDCSVAVVIPALNEEGAMGHVLCALPTWVDIVVVADNGSSDETADIARRHGAVVVYEPRRGYGAACIRGLSAVGSPDIVVFLDADNSDDPSEMADLIAPIARGEADLVVGSRALGEAEPGSLTWPQQFGNALASMLMRKIWGQTCTDLGPFRAVRFSALLELNMNDLDYGWTVQMQARAFRHGLRVTEVPVRYRRRIGRSKISGTVRGVVSAGTKILLTIAREALADQKAAPRQRALLVFTRYPEPGKVKTRLIPELGADCAANLQRKMTSHTLAVAKRWGKRVGSTVTVLFDGGDADAMGVLFGHDLQYLPQGEGTLGERLYRAFDMARRNGIDEIVAIGSDCPSIDVTQIDAAFDSLPRHDVVLGPATDGGYYLIGMTTPHGELFDNISWGTDRVLAQSLEACKTHGLHVALLGVRHDIDTPADLPHWDKIARTTEANGNDVPYLSIVIPTVNEELHLSETLETIGAHRDVEIVVADGGSTDQTRPIATSLGARIVPAMTGRASQMNAGAAAARGEVLLFLHADTRLPFGYLNQISDCLNDRRASAGAFRFALDDTRLIFRLIEVGTNLRSIWFGLPFGDQGIFLRKQTFTQIGGFRELPAMEDYDLLIRLKANGRINVARTSAITSARRWLTQGMLRTSLTHLCMIAGWYLGVAPERLASWRERRSGANPRKTHSGSYREEFVKKSTGRTPERLGILPENEHQKDHL